MSVLDELVLDWVRRAVVKPLVDAVENSRGPSRKIDRRKFKRRLRHMAGKQAGRYL